MIALTVFHTRKCNKNVSFKITYLGYGESFGPIQFTSSVNALPDTYLSFVSLVHRSVEYEGHNDFDRTDELTNGSVHIIKIVEIVRTCSVSGEIMEVNLLIHFGIWMDASWHEILFYSLCGMLQ